MGVQQIHTIHSIHQVAFCFCRLLNVSSSSYFLLEALSFKALLKNFSQNGPYPSHHCNIQMLIGSFIWS